jgi:hypothetical protein
MFLIKLTFLRFQEIKNMSSARDRGSSRRQSHSSNSNRHSSRRRKDRQKKHHLTQEDIEYLKKNTRYDESEIREWYKGFKARAYMLLSLSVKIIISIKHPYVKTKIVIYLTQNSIFKG